MNKIMLDLETMGSKPGAAIISIGAVFFSPKDGLGETFHERIDLESAVKAGLKMDASTVKWWMEQSKEAQAVMRPGAMPLEAALELLTDFVNANADSTEVEVWGNGSDFDNVLLGAAYEACSLKAPWKFYRGRCFRTLKNLPGAPKAPKFAGTKHDALDDAKNQATHAIAILNWLGKK